MTPNEQEASSSTPDGSSPNEPLMLAQGGSSDVTGREYTTTSSTTYPPRAHELDLENLSPRAQAIKLLFADEMSDGFTLTMLAAELGLSPSSALAYLNELREEARQQRTGGLLPPLSNEEYEGLKESIGQDGICVPVVLGKTGVVDGRHRLHASVELNLVEKDVPVYFLKDYTEEEEKELAVALNSARRQLSIDWKQKRVRTELLRDWNRSSRQIAALCGTSHQTVELVREKMRKERDMQPSPEFVAAVEDQVVTLLPPVPSREEDVRKTASGQEQKAYADGRGLAPQMDRPLGYITVEQPGRYAIYKDGEGVRAERV